MTAELRAQLERCDRELDAINHSGAAPAFLIIMGDLDWRLERALIEEELRES